MTQPQGARRLLVVGAGGHAKVVIEVARAAGWFPAAAVDPGGVKDVLGVPVGGTDGDILSILDQYEIGSVVIAVGDNRLRQVLAQQVRSHGCPTPAIIHPAAAVSPSAGIGDGVVIMAGVVINADATVGEDSIVNTSAIVEHDCVLGPAVHAAPRTVMGGWCHIGQRTLFGIGASARPRIQIGEDVVVGAGAVVVSNVADGLTVAGNPARPLPGNS